MIMCIYIYIFIHIHRLTYIYMLRSFARHGASRTMCIVSFIQDSTELDVSMSGKVPVLDN